MSGQRSQSPKGGEGQENKNSYSRHISRCPSCRHEYDTALLLPCSHTLCARCVAAGEHTGPGHSHSHAHSGATLPVCCVLCPCCSHLVELPCWDWASAALCLPQDPTLSPRYPNQETEAKVKAHLQDMQGGMHSTHVKDPEGKGSGNGLTMATSSKTPMDGAVDLREEEMEQSVLGLSFALDPSSVPPSLCLSNSSLTVTFRGDSPPVSLSNHQGNRVRESAEAIDPQVTLPLLYVFANIVIARGQYYWEVDVCNSAIYRIGVTSSDGSAGWWLERRDLSFWTVYDGSRELLHTVPPHIKTLGVFLNIGGGALSFHNPLTQEHLATLPTRFSQNGMLPALGLGQGKLKLRCGLPPPPHVFLSRASAYRGPCVANGGRWHRDVPFQSVRAVIQKFEELALSDTDSGMVSSFGSSCNTLTSLPGPGPDLGRTFNSWQEGHEAGEE